MQLDVIERQPTEKPREGHSFCKLVWATKQDKASLLCAHPPCFFFLPLRHIEIEYQVLHRARLVSRKRKAVKHCVSRTRPSFTPKPTLHSYTKIMKWK